VPEVVHAKLRAPWHTRNSVAALPTYLSRCKLKTVRLRLRV
jgi:hypothetical protein